MRAEAKSLRLGKLVLGQREGVEAGRSLRVSNGERLHLTPLQRACIDQNCLLFFNSKFFVVIIKMTIL